MHCRIQPYWIKAAPLRGTAAPLPAPRSALMARSRGRAAPTCSSPQFWGNVPPISEEALSLPDCLAREHSVKGGPLGRRKRSAAPTLDPTPARLGSAAIESDEDV